MRGKGRGGERGHRFVCTFSIAVVFGVYLMFTCGSCVDGERNAMPVRL